MVAAARVRSQPVLGVVDNQLIHIVTRQTAPGVGQHLLVGIGSCVGSDINEVDRLAQLYRILGRSSKEIIVVAIGDLVIDAISPVVICHITVFAVHVAVNIKLSPNMLCGLISRVGFHIL